MAQSVAHRTLGREVPSLIPVRGVVFCGLEQVTFPQLNVYSVHMFNVYSVHMFNVYSVYMFLNSHNKSSTELTLIVEI